MLIEASWHVTVVAKVSAIRGLAIRETRFLDSIEVAQMQQQIQKKVTELTKQNQNMIADTNGIQPSLSEENIRQYLDQVLNELENKKASTNKSF